jgi:hypothetical protein
MLLYFSLAVVRFFVCHPVRDLLLPLSVPPSPIPRRCLSLPLHVPAVILTLSLSKGKDPEELNAPKPSLPFNPYLLRLCRRLFSPTSKQKPSSRPKLLTHL